jgi:hypothetical protein
MRDSLAGVVAFDFSLEGEIGCGSGSADVSVMASGYGVLEHGDIKQRF